MRSTFSGFLLRFATVMAIAIGSSFAQTPANDHPGSLPILLGNETVRKELRLSSLQIALLKSLRGEYRDSVRELTHPMPKTETEVAAAEKKFRTLSARFNQRALSVMNSSQRERFLEIEHQVLGATGLMSSSVQSKLQLTERQKQKIDSIHKKGLRSVGKINRRFSEDRFDADERLQLLRKHRISEGKSLLKVLTPEQQTAFDQLGGKPLASDSGQSPRR